MFGTGVRNWLFRVTKSVFADGKSESCATQTVDGEDDVLSALECTICLDLLLDPLTLGCGHSFCVSCIARDLSQKAEPRVICPCCRHEQKEKVGPNFALRRVVRCCYPVQEACRRKALTGQDNLLVTKLWLHWALCREQTTVYMDLRAAVLGLWESVRLPPWAVLAGLIGTLWFVHRVLLG